jgi:CRP-like cAMP-binding protein
MGLRPELPRLLSGLPAHLSTELFAGAERVRLSEGQVLFRAGDSGDGCYRIDNGLLKVTFRTLAASAALPSSARAPSSASFR